MTFRADSVKSSLMSLKLISTVVLSTTSIILDTEVPARMKGFYFTCFHEAWMFSNVGTV